MLKKNVLQETFKKQKKIKKNGNIAILHLFKKKKGNGNVVLWFAVWMEVVKIHCLVKYTTWMGLSTGTEVVLVFKRRMLHVSGLEKPRVKIPGSLVFANAPKAKRCTTVSLHAP